MNYMVLFGRRTSRSLCNFRRISRLISGGSYNGNGGESGNEDSYKMSETLGFDSASQEKQLWEEEETILGASDTGEEDDSEQHFSPRQRFFANIEYEADRIFIVLQQDGPGFDTKGALDELQIKVSNPLVRKVLIRILKNINPTSKSRCARLGYKFFVWSGQQINYKHTTDTYHLVMKIFAECEEFKAMWRLVDEMTENGLPITARTFNILICTCGEVGMARRLVERFIKSKTFNYRPFKHSFNAILHSLLVINQHNLIEWVYQQMLLEGHSPDVLTYNILISTKYRLAKLDQFHRLLDEMGRSGLSPDLHTYNILLQVLGKGDKPLAALNLLNHMKDVGCDPSVLHYSRPHLVELVSSNGVVVSNLTFLNSPAWHIHPVYCSNVHVHNITVIAPSDSPYTDGIVPDSSDQVCIENCTISVGHDAISLKSGWDEYGIAYGRPTTNVRIKGVHLQAPYGSGIAFGSQMSGGISNVRAELLHIHDSHSGIEVKTTKGRGGYIKDILISGMEMENIQIAFEATGQCKSHPDDNFDPKALPVVDRITLRNVRGSNITRAGDLSGIPESPFTSICLSNISLKATSATSTSSTYWICSNVFGYSESVFPEPCPNLQGSYSNSSSCYSFQYLNGHSEAL